MDSINNSFMISDSFYKMEYGAPAHSIFDIYDIASWNIVVINRYEQITTVELLVYFNELIKFCPWLYVKNERVSTENERAMFDSRQSYIDFNIDLLKSVNVNNSIEWYLGFFECGFYTIYHGDTVDMSHKEQIKIYPFFDTEYKTLSFSLDFKMDVFFPNPSRQPGVTLPEDYIKVNRCLLSFSLKAIDNSGIFKIRTFESEFYPKEIAKYGFEDLS